MGAEPLNVLFDMLGGAEVLSTTVFSDGHLEKAEPPILFSAAGSSTMESMVHSSKAELLISLTATGNVRETRLVHLENAASPMLVSAGGNVISDSVEQPWKALRPILRTVFGMVIERRLLQLRNMSLVISVIRPLMTTLSSEVQSSKALVPISLTNQENHTHAEPTLTIHSLLPVVAQPQRKTRSARFATEQSLQKRIQAIQLLSSLRIKKT